MENKEIRFIDSHYNELFRIPDGCQITIHYPDGHKENRVCQYIDDYHTYINGVCFHICQFAEIMERNGNKYSPTISNFEKLKQEDLKFVGQNYDDINKDKFFKTDNGITEVYYNPDANSGGQLVYLEISSTDIENASKECKTKNDFFAYIESAARGYLVDVGTPAFMENAKSFINRKADFEGCTDKTMKSLKKFAGVEKAKPPKEPER